MLNYVVDNDSSLPGKIGILESPYYHPNFEGRVMHLMFARAAAREMDSRRELVYGSHLLLTQAGILDDQHQEERERGLEHGIKLAERIGDFHAVYTNFGISMGMQKGIDSAHSRGKRIIYRTLERTWLKEQVELIKNHSDSGLWIPEKLIHSLNGLLISCKGDLSVMVRYIQETRG